MKLILMHHILTNRVVNDWIRLIKMWRKENESCRFFKNTIQTQIREKGNNSICFPDEYIVLDIETTGFSFNYDSIIELAAIKVKQDKVTDFFESFVNLDYIQNL